MKKTIICATASLTLNALFVAAALASTKPAEDQDKFINHLEPSEVVVKPIEVSQFGNPFNDSIDEHRRQQAIDQKIWESERRMEFEMEQRIQDAENRMIRGW